MELKEYVEKKLKFIAEEEPGTLNDIMKPCFYGGEEGQQCVKIKYPILDWERNGLGTLHGGMISTMMDFTMSLGVQYFAGSTIPPTVSLTINFIRPVPVDGGIVISCKVTSIGRKIGTAYCEAVIPGSGKTAATATGIFHLAGGNPQQAKQESANEASR